MFNIRVVYESTPIRHIAVQCPKCSKWFCGNDIASSYLSYDYEIDFAEFMCPVCGEKFGDKSNDWLRNDNCKPQIKEVDSAEECYKDCLHKKEVWE